MKLIGVQYVRRIVGYFVMFYAKFVGRIGYAILYISVAIFVSSIENLIENL